MICADARRSIEWRDASMEVSTWCCGFLLTGYGSSGVDDEFYVGRFCCYAGFVCMAPDSSITPPGGEKRSSSTLLSSLKDDGFGFDAEPNPCFGRGHLILMMIFLLRRHTYATPIVDADNPPIMLKIHL